MLESIDCIVHLAARAHTRIGGTAADVQRYRDTNTTATFRLVKAAVERKVKRFVFVSSIKVNGESTDDRAAFTPYEDPHPEDLYGTSKLEAEQAVRDETRHSTTEFVIVRPPLVYGRGSCSTGHHHSQLMRQSVIRSDS